MKILSPIDNLEEFEALADAGAHEVYGGVMPDGWRWDAVSANQRTFASAQFASEKLLYSAVTKAQKAGVSFHVTLNSPLYPADSYDDLLAFCRRAVGEGVASLIVGDLGLLIRLKGSGLPVTLSTMAGAMNSQTVQFYKGFGLERAVLPRHLNLLEMAAIVQDHPELGFEAFVLIGKCPNEEGFCTFQHISPQKRWPCEIPYTLKTLSGDDLPSGHPLNKWHAGWRLADRRMACGLCFVSEIEAMGVKVLKLVGRGGPTPGKVANIKFVRTVLEGSRDPDDVKARYRERFGRECSEYVCYFP